MRNLKTRVQWFVFDFPKTAEGNGQIQNRMRSAVKVGILAAIVNPSANGLLEWHSELKRETPISRLSGQNLGQGVPYILWQWAVFADFHFG